MGKHIKKRIKNKHQHHEDMLRKQITEELFAEATEQMTRYINRIDYLVGANNELMKELRELEKNQSGYVHIPNATADCILLENTAKDDLMESF
jgi:uncharacterized protein (UPF0335 family)